MDNNLEGRLSSLEAQLKALSVENERLKAVNEIQNLMARFEYFHTARMHGEVAKLFTSEREDVFFSLDGIGIFSGQEGIKRLFTRFFPLIQGPDPRGLMRIHAVTSSVLEVAGDGKTARGVWVSPGHETATPPGGSKPVATWVWSYLECDFIKDSSGWKIWHYTLHPIIKTPYDTSWVDTEYLPPEGDPLPPDIGPDKPNPLWTAYSPDTVRDLVPEPPFPYAASDLS